MFQRWPAASSFGWAENGTCSKPSFQVTGPMRRQVLRIERERRAAFPHRQHAAGVLDRVGVGDVDRIGPLDRRVARDRRAEGRVEKATGLALGGELGRAHQAADVGDAAAGEGELLHHAVAVEPVVVALAVALEQGRPVAIEAAAQAGRPAAGDGERFAAQVGARRVGVVDALERREPGHVGDGGIEGGAFAGARTRGGRAARPAPAAPRRRRARRGRGRRRGDSSRACVHGGAPGVRFTSRA